MNNTNKHGAVKTVSLMVAAMCISKVLGMLRSVLMAHSYGISHEATVFSEASRIPLTFFDILLGSAILGCFIPIYNGFKGARRKDGRSESDVFASVFLNFIVLLTAVLSVLGIIFARELLGLVASGLDDELIGMAITPLRIMFPLIVFTGMTYTLVGVLQSKDEFLIPAFISAFSNLLVIIYFIFFNKYFGIIGLSICYTLSWAVQFLTLIIPLKRRGFKYSFDLDFRNTSFIKALKMTPPIMCGAWLTPISLLLGLYFAAYVKVDGAVASFDYATNLFNIIVGILTYGVCNFVFPRLSRLSGDDADGFVKTASDSLFYSFMIILPVMTAMSVVSGQVVSIIYQRGEFDAVAAGHVATALKALVPGMLGFTAVELLNRVFYARQIAKVPMIAALCGIAVNAVTSYIVIMRLNLGLSALGFAFATGLCAAAVVLCVCAGFKLKGMFGKRFFVKLLKLLVCAGVGWGVMKGLDALISPTPFSDGFVLNVLTGGGIFVVGTGVYLILCKIFGLLNKE